MKKLPHYPRMSIVVLNWNGLDDTKICLEHLRKLDYPNYEIIVVDNGSRAEQKKYLSKVKDIVYVDNPTNRGFTGGHIDGFAKASGEFVVLLNNDAVMQKDYLKLALKSFDDPKVAAVGGRSYFWNDDQPILDTSNSFYAYQEINVRTGEAFMLSTDYGVPQVVNNVSGSAVVIRRSIIDEVGYLYDRFFAYFEETDLFARIKRAGYTVLYDPQLHIWHRNGASSGASSGSHFFYYQIFRNRFIFAMRNFETKSLVRFWYIYCRIGFSSLLRWWLRPGSANKVMNRAYAKAAIYNVVHLPLTYASRLRLRMHLGKSRYNHIIYQEQTGLSVVYDCSEHTATQIKALQEHLATDTNPLHEYILVTREEMPIEFSSSQPNLRHVIDRGYFNASPYNLGCLAARFDWMALCDTKYPAKPDVLRQALASTMNSAAGIVAFGDETQCSPTVLIHKQFFTFVGGVEQKNALVDSSLALMRYAKRSKRLSWFRGNPDDHKPIELRISKQQSRAIDIRLKIDGSIARDGQLSLFGRIKAKYYRIYQFTSLIRWLFLRNVSLYLKAARIKNLVLFTVTLRRHKLALELKHIRNEVILNTTPGDLGRQKKITERRIKELLKDPSDITVFIICRDRVNDLRLLVRWLEQNGLHKITFIDNDSVYPPLVDYLHKTPYQVIKLYRNVGHTSPWGLGLVRALVPEDFYIVSDPDVIPTKDCPKDVLKHFLDVHKQYFMYLKVGFGLRIDDLPDHYRLKQSVIEWESQFWKQELAPGVYEAGVDTTFALYKPFTYTYKLHPSLRTGAPYVARHMPWYMDPEKISEEERHYRFRADHNVSSWNADELEDRYEKELNKKRKD
ncbi:MAG TPA: glycosyltransferase family 2 protein [Candidatus Saccharimonadales bacterium]|jgi:GT2 family glycosyltransferase|nr:glycosyltransferase family 2 protein [Candidatus Saccharimonadales bacterium]